MAPFSPQKDIPDLTGKVVIVTGGNSGIGFETCKALLVKNAKVYLAARSEERAVAAIEKLKQITGKEAHWLKLDLADLTTIKATAEDFKRKESCLDVLFLNAGVMIPPPEHLTVQGYDLQFGVNCVGHYALQMCLLPLLENSTSATKPRVVWVSSDGHRLAPGGTGILWDTLKGGEARDTWVKSQWQWKAPWTLYGQSKLGNVLLANHLSRTQSDFVAVSLHPGLIPDTNLKRYTPGWLVWISSWFGLTNEHGAVASLFAGVGSEAEVIDGKETEQYCLPGGKLGQCDPRGNSEALQDELVAWLEKEVAEYV